MPQPLPGPGAAAGYLGMIVGHHVWATLVLLDRCLELSPDELELSTPGGYGSLRATLTHVVRADYRYQWRILGLPERADVEPEPPVAALRAEMETQRRRWQEVLDRLPELDYTLPAFPDDDPPYPEIEHAVGLLITQAVHHGNEHRAHACSILGAHGLEPPDLSGWQYALQLEVDA